MHTSECFLSFIFLFLVCTLYIHDYQVNAQLKRDTMVSLLPKTTSSTSYYTIHPFAPLQHEVIGVYALCIILFAVHKMHGTDTKYERITDGDDPTWTVSRIDFFTSSRPPTSSHFTLGTYSKYQDFIFIYQR